jgi:transcriptional regulator with XRE-family HTH domain
MAHVRHGNNVLVKIIQSSDALPQVFLAVHGSAPAGRVKWPIHGGAEENMLHQHLRPWREHAGMTLQKVAEALSVSHSAVQKWETGRSPVTLDVLHDLAPIYGAQPFELLFPPAEREKAAPLAEAWAILRKLTPEQVNAWLLTGRSMAGLPPAGESPPAPE